MFTDAHGQVDRLEARLRLIDIRGTCVLAFGVAGTDNAGYRESRIYYLEDVISRACTISCILSFKASMSAELVTPIFRVCVSPKWSVNVADGLRITFH